MTIDVPLREIRHDLEDRIARLRRRHGIGRVEKDRGTLSGRERIAGTRITPDAVVRLVEAGWSQVRIVREYPGLRSADIAAAVRSKKAG